jgi:hypothetical protein
MNRLGQKETPFAAQTTTRDSLAKPVQHFMRPDARHPGGGPLILQVGQHGIRTHSRFPTKHQ